MNNFPYDIESRANRYLDGELSAQELTEFSELLASSQEVRTLVRELELIRSTARAFPTLTAPDPTVESGLFQMIFGEDELVEEEENRRRAAFFPLLRQGVASFASTAVGRTAMALPVVLLLLLFAEEKLSNRAGPTTAHVSGAIAQFDPIQTASQQNPVLRIATPSNEVPKRASASPLDPVVILLAEPHSESSVTETTETTVDDPKAPENNGLDSDANTFAFNNNIIPDASAQEEGPKPDLDGLFAEFEDPRSSTTESGFLSASYRHGLSTFLGAEKNLGQDMKLRVDGELSGGHRLSLSFGSSPVLVSERTYTLRSSVNEKGQPGPASVSIDNDARTDDELWAGIGYGYTLLEGKRVSLEAGVTVGLGTSTTRYGLELPARFSLGDRLDIEVVPTLTRVMPHDQEIHAQDITFDPNRFGEEWTPNTTSIGLQAGISLAIGE